MRKMKDSGIAWIGEIPEEWKIMPIKRIAKILRGGSPRPIEQYMSLDDKGYNWIRIGDSKKGSKYICSTQRKIIPDGLSKTRLIKKGSLILSNSMSFGQPYILEIDGCIHDGWVAFSDLSVEKEFLYYYLVSDFAHTQFEQQVSGGVVLNLNIDKIGTNQILIPNINEQRRIAAYLDDKCAHIDAVIEKTRASIDEYKKLKQAIITRAVTKGLRQGRKMKDSGIEWIGEIPEEWNINKLGVITKSMRNGYVGPTKDILVSNGVRYIQSLHVKEGKISFDSHPYYVNEEWAREHPKIHTNDILIVQTGDIGNVCLVSPTFDNCNCHALIIATPDIAVMAPQYLTYYLLSHVGKELLLFHKTGALLPHLNSGKIKFAQICVPPLPEQQEIASYLDVKTAAIDRLIAKKEQLAAEMESCKKSLIYEVVTGKREVAI